MKERTKVVYTDTDGCHVKKEMYNCSYEYVNYVTGTSIKSEFVRETEDEIKTCIRLLRDLTIRDMIDDSSKYKEEYMICLDDTIEEVYKDEHV